MKKRILVWAGAACGLTLALGATVGVHQVSKLPLDHFVNKLTVMELPTTATTVEDLFSEATTHAEVFLTTPVEWTADSGSLIATPMNLGLQIQLEALESELERLESSSLAKLRLFVSSIDLTIPASVDEEFLQQAFVDSGIEQGMKNANYYYEGGVQIDPEQIGYGIEYEALSDQLVTLWEVQELSESETLPIRVSEPTITAKLLEEHREKVSALAASGLTIQENDGTEWNLKLSDHLNWIIPSDESFTLNDTAFYSYLRDEIAPEVEIEAQPVSISLVDGNYHFEGSARNGRMIAYEATLLEVEAMINSEETAPVVLSINEVEPEITVPEELALLGVTDLLGFGYSNFSGSPTARVYNVNHGMELFNGTMLAPGEEFSFTTLMGDIDAANGWYPELVIKGDETIPEYGGGLCQVSSTMFRAALLTGMPITRRKNHSYAVSYYAYPDGYGLDATIYDPYPDFRFINDTTGHMLIQGYTDGVEAYFVFYGTSDGRSVTMEKGDAYGYNSIAAPQITYTDELAPGVRVLEEYAHTGFKIDWWRTIYYADGTESERENFHSNYQARPAKYSEGRAVEEGEGLDKTSSSSEN